MILPKPMLLALALVSANAQALNADELIERNIQARGGLEQIHAIKSLRMEGTLRISGGFGSFDLGVVQVKKAPEAMRSEVSMQGLTQVQAWDGKEAWQISPFQGRKDPERMSADDARGLADSASIAGPLVAYREQGNTVEYQGIEDVDGTEAHKLKVTLKNGDVQTVYLDPDHFIEIRVVTKLRVRGTEVEQVTDLGEYERIAGVYFPFSIVSHSPGDGGQQQLSISKAEANVAVDDVLFAFPAAKGGAK